MKINTFSLLTEQKFARNIYMQTLSTVSYLNVSYHLIGYKQNDSDEYNKYYMQFWTFTEKEPSENYLDKIDVTILAANFLKSTDTSMDDDIKYINLISSIIEESDYFRNLTINQKLRDNFNAMQAQIEAQNLKEDHCSIGMSSKKNLAAL